MRLDHLVYGIALPLDSRSSSRRWTHLSSNGNSSCIEDLHRNLETLPLLSKQVPLRDVNILNMVMMVAVVVVISVVAMMMLVVVVMHMIFSQQVPLRDINILKTPSYI